MQRFVLKGCSFLFFCQKETWKNEWTLYGLSVRVRFTPTRADGLVLCFLVQEPVLLSLFSEAENVSQVKKDSRVY